MEPPAKKKHSAEAEHAPDALDDRLRDLAEDYTLALREHPTEENLNRATLLAVLSCSPDRARLLAGHNRQRDAEAAGTQKTFWRWAWVRLVEPLAARCDFDPKAVARELVVLMPVSLRVKCPGCPTNDAELESAVAAVVNTRNFDHELVVRRQDLDPLKVARAVLRALGVSKDDAKSLLRTSQWEAWTRDHAETGREELRQLGRVRGDDET